MAYPANKVNISPRPTVLVEIERTIDRSLMDADWVARTRNVNNEGLEYWVVEVKLPFISQLSPLEIAAVDNAYRQAGWDHVTFWAGYRDQGSFTLYKRPTFSTLAA